MKTFYFSRPFYNPIFKYEYIKFLSGFFSISILKKLTIKELSSRYYGIRHKLLNNGEKKWKKNFFMK